MKIPRAALLLTFAALFLGRCTSTSDGPPPPPAGGRFERAMPAGGFDLMLPMSWWHEARLAEPLALSGDQFQRLDAVEPKQEEVARLGRDAMVAERELRTALEARNATATDIVAAGGHLRELRQVLLERQIEVVAAQREVLTLDQWTTLQSELAADRRPQRSGREWGGGPGGGGRGGRGGGRRPPF